MDRIHKRGKEIREFILENIEKKNISALVAEKFKISRQGTARHIKTLAEEGLIESSGKSRNKSYKLKTLSETKLNLSNIPLLSEDKVWRQEILPKLPDLPENVKNICQHGFTEMLNNVIDHSGASTAGISMSFDALNINLVVYDDGVGIFKKIKSDFNLDDERHAILELSKGKLTSDPLRHSGEGIFFTSRMFDSFTIISGSFSLVCTKGKDWLFESVESIGSGTAVFMVISRNSARTTKEVFDKYVSDENNYGFSKTIIPVGLLQYEGESLVSRSQAKRLIARFEKFNEVLLDFTGVKTIGQAFADEVFRVFKNLHPEVNLYYFNTLPDVEAMIRRSIHTK